MALTDNLVSYWKLDESSGNAADSVGSKTLTNNGTITYSAGKINNGADFNGSSNYFSRTAETTGLSNAFSISAWVKFNASGAQEYIFRYRPSSGDANEIRLVKSAGNKLEGTIINPAGSGTGYKQYLGNTTLSTSTWYLVGLTWNGTSLKLYVNGVEDTPYSLVNDTSVGTMTDTSRILGIGGWNGSVFGNVSLDEMGMWSRALTSGEFAALYSTGDGQAYPLDTVFGVFNQIADTNNDVFDDGSAIDLDGDSELVIGQHPSLPNEYEGGFRFTGLAIPQGATIEEAKIRLVNQANSNGTPSFIIKGEDTDDAAIFSTHADFIARTRTTASVAWIPGAQTAGSSVMTVDIKDIVQEIVDRGSWASGNDMAFFIENNGTNSWILVYDYTGSATNSAQIQIAYSLGETFTITETTTLTESFTSSRTRLFSVTETTTLSETLTALKGIAFTVAESLGLVETFTSARTFVFSVAESLGIIEVLAQVRKKWNNVTKSSSSWTNESKNSSSWTNQTKS